MPDLKLIALDAEDLSILAANLQDAVLRVGDMTFLKREGRFVLVVNRFDWTEAHANGATFARRRTGVRFDRVQSVKVAGIDMNAKETALSLLTIGFTQTADPSGFILLQFSGGGAIRLEVECIEAALDDLGAAWATRHRPEHPEGGSAEG